MARVAIEMDGPGEVLVGFVLFVDFLRQEQRVGTDDHDLPRARNPSGDFGISRSSGSPPAMKRPGAAFLDCLHAFGVR